MAAGNRAIAYLDMEDRTGGAFQSFRKNLESAGAVVGRLNGLLATFGVAGGAAGLVGFGAMIKSTADLQDQVGKMSQRIGVGVESLSELTHAAALSGVGVDALGNGLRDLGKRMAETQANLGESKIAFDVLKIAVTNSSGQLRTTDEVFGDIADAFANMRDGAGKTAIAMRLFGDAGAAMIPLLNKGRTGLREAADEARRFGIVISSEAAKQAEVFNQNLTRLGASIEGIKLAIGNSALPALNEWTAANLEAIKIAGGLGEALRLFVFNLEGLSAEKPAEQIRRLTKALEEYQAATAGGKFLQSPTGFLFGGREDDLKKQIEFLKYLQRQEALRGNENIPLDPGLRRFQRDKAAAPALPDLEGMRRALADAEKLRQADIAGWVRYADQVFQEADAENLALAKSMEDFFADQERLRQEDIKGWVAYAETVFEAADAENLALAKTADQAKKTNDIARDLGLTFSSAFEDAVINGEEFSKVLRGIEQDLLRLFTRKLITEPLFKEFDTLLEGFGGSGGNSIFSGLGSLIGDVFKGFQHGGSFTVRGAGGTDSQLVAFRATPGEHVTVRTPAQLAAGAAGGGATMNITVNVPESTTRASADQIAAHVGRAVARATRRNS